MSGLNNSVLPLCPRNRSRTIKVILLKRLHFLHGLPLKSGPGLEFDMKCHILHDFGSSAPFKENLLVSLEIFIN